MSLRTFVAASIVLCGFSPAALARTSMKKAAAAAPGQKASGAPAQTQPESSQWDFVLKPDDSIFAIVTRKTGFAAKLAHNHLIAARQFQASLSADPGKINEGKFTFKTKVSDLEFDRSDLQKQWFPTLQALGWLNEPYSTLSDSDRETIREHAFAANQLDADKFQTIEANIEKITDVGGTVGTKSFSKTAEVAMTVRGQTVKKTFLANIVLQGQELRVEAVANMKFTDFKITPYKALMGAVGNEDGFYTLVSFRAVKK